MVMEIWLDTCDINAIRHAANFGIIKGVTTNPTLLAQVPHSLEKSIENILQVQKGPLCIQVLAENTEEIVKRSLALYAFSNRIIIKIPATEDGFIAIKQLSEKQIPTLATAIFEPRQALLAALAGAHYVAPYVGRMFDAGIEAYSSLKTMVNIYKQAGFKTKIMAAALRTNEQIVACAEIGLDAVTLKNTLFSQFVADDPLTTESLIGMAQDWKARDSKTSSVLLL